MYLEPIEAGQGVDFVGELYTIHELPPIADEGDTCEINWPGGSGWYKTWYIWNNGMWLEQGTTAPWQLSG